MRRIALALSILPLVAATGASADREGSPPIADPRASHAATDENGDGQIDREEFHHRMVEVFYFSDRDKSGECDRDELDVHDEEALFDHADRDGNGKLSMYEFVNGRFVDFEEADTDDDGTLSVEEVVAEFEK